LIKRKALVFGGTGLTGSELIHQLSQDDRYHEVVMFVREETNLVSSKVHQVVIDFDHLEKYASFIQGDDLFICLGSTMAKAGSKEAFFKIDHDYVLQAAQIAASAGVKRTAVITAAGSNAKSLFFYPKVKGLVEEKLMKLGFESLYILRPSLLLGPRKEFRRGERLAVKLSEWVPGIYTGPFHKYRPIQASVVARAMIQLMQADAKGSQIYESEDIQKIGAL
jgi:uncharacterized protein YbjT (DUF2867 family)